MGNVKTMRHTKSDRVLSCGASMEGCFWVMHVFPVQIELIASHQKIRPPECIPVHSGHKTLTHYFSSLGGTGTDSTKSIFDMLRRTCVFHPVGYAAHVVHAGASGA
jgi:hypothetical protein